MDHPALPKHQGNLNDSLCNNSNTEAGVLMTITGDGPTPLEGGTYYHWWRNPASRHCYTPGSPHLRRESHMDREMDFPSRNFIQN
ncbi:hypothetical protein AVEN_121820-1 [Araneus ventricosus]|uniref:Uncharacterized protein n=1 Tax=Araneus ventricosus TaxID=182803 RepID=A0A4Y2SSW5_ARAVE|nr:hypothetical protein AVEN_33783-1 [Araneus ventricosus]GBN90755.1 hypothetical protein AVEN_121820-1 [Araneus ventricosus]